MLATPSAPPDAAARLIVRWAQRIMSADLEWFTSGVFPGEMAAFLGLCDLHGVKTIIESGRLHGYSTSVLGEYARETSCRVFSIDTEADRAIATACRERLRGYDGLNLLAGDAFDLLPHAARQASGPIALLVDGPKMFDANRLSATACALYDVVLVTHHNAGSDTPYGRQFARWFPGTRFYESMGVAGVPGYGEFKEWERRTTVGVHPGRSVYRSDLALAPVTGRERRKRRLLTLDRRPTRRHPLLLALKWWRVAR